MQTITLKINDNIFDKFQWLLNHFSKNEISIVNDIDTSKFSKNDFEEYNLWYINWYLIRKLSNLFKKEI